MVGGGAEGKRLGERLRQAREAAGLSQSDVCGLLGFRQSKVSRLESGEYGVTLLELRRLAYCYDVTVGWFMACLDDMGPPPLAG